MGLSGEVVPVQPFHKHCNQCSVTYKRPSSTKDRARTACSDGQAHISAFVFSSFHDLPIYFPLWIGFFSYKRPQSILSYYLNIQRQISPIFCQRLRSKRLHRMPLETKILNQINKIYICMYVYTHIFKL